MDHQYVDHRYLASDKTAIEQTTEVTVDTLLKMALDSENNLIEANKILNEKRATLTGSSSELLGVKINEDHDRPVETLYGVLRRIGNLSSATRNIAVKF